MMNNELYRAAANNDIRTLKGQLEAGVNPNSQESLYGNIPLVIAVSSRHVDAVRLLLDYGADPSLKNRSGENAIEANIIYQHKEIFNMLNPEIAAARYRRKQELTALQRNYAATHTPHNPRTLHKIGDEYNSSENVTIISSAQEALQYMQDAIYYMAIESLEAQKFEKDSDERWNISAKIIRFKNTISACAFYMIRDHKPITDRTPGIDWKILSSSIRAEQYHPFFLTGMSYQRRAELIRAALVDLSYNSDLEKLKAACAKLQADINTQITEPVAQKLSRLYNFFSDEYNAQYIEDAIKNFLGRENNADFRVRLLRSIAIIGEAFRHSSSIIKGQFNNELVKIFVAARDVIGHPERPKNRQAIDQVLSGANHLGTNIGEITLVKFVKGMELIYPVIVRYLECYDAEQMSIERIWNYISNIQITLPAPNPPQNTPQADNELTMEELRQIPVEYRTNIEMTKLRDYDLEKSNLERDSKLKALRNNFIKWVDENDPHTGRKEQKFRAKLDDPLNKALPEMEKCLEENKTDYRSAKAKKVYNRSKEEKKLVKDYENLERKNENWAEYARNRSSINMVCEDKKNDIEARFKNDQKVKVIAILKSCLKHSEFVETYFKKLNDHNFVRTTSNNYTSRGFGSHPDHHLLEFYQTMVGSIARCLTNPSDPSGNIFMSKASDRLQKILENTARPSRGFLAHIGVRQLGKSAPEAQDRANVFYTNSKEIVESIPMMRNVIYALENNVTYDVAAQQNRSVHVNRGQSR